MTEHCDHFREMLESMISRDLPREDREALDRHLAECSDCRSYLQSLRNDDEALSAFAVSMQGLGSRIQNAVFQAGDQTAQTAPRKPRFWSRPAVRFAAAAAIIAAIVLVSSLFDSTPRRDVVWAEVAKNIEVAESIENPPGYIYRAKTVKNGRVIANMVRYKSPELGLRMETYKNGEPFWWFIYSLKSNTYTMIDFQQKVFLLDSIGPDSWYKFGKDAHLRKMREFMQRDHISLGFSEINGRTVSGIEMLVTNPPERGERRERRWRIFADIETQLPVSFENLAVSDSVDDYRRTDYEWNPEFNPEDFDPPPPDGFLVADLRAPIEDLVASATAGFRNFAKITGRYPKSPSFYNLRREVAAELESLKQAGVYTPGIEDSLNTILDAGALARWRDHAPRELWSPRYGDYDPSVVPGDSENILMRWKMFDKAGLIYGDLRYEVVDSAPYDEIDRKRWEEYMKRNEELNKELQKKLGVDSLAGPNDPSQ